jgi:hypothetical protein
MNIARSDLYRIILEEYLLDEGRGDDAAEDLLKKILGDRYQTPEERDPVRYAKHDGATAPMEKPHAQPEIEVVPAPDETYALEEPASARATLSTDELAATIGELIHGRDPEEVSEIFQLAFEKLPGVELSSPGDEDYPGEETLYSPGAEGRPVAGFQLEELLSLIKEVIAEGHYRDMGDEDEMYELPDAGVEPKTMSQRIEDAYHDLQDAFRELESEAMQDLGFRIISDLQTLLDVVEHPEDYHE